MGPSNSEVLCDMTTCHWKVAVYVSKVLAVPSSGYKQCEKYLCWNYVHAESGFSNHLRNVGNYQ